ncbi:MAG: hypothetical protein LBC35_06610 [Coriobacteriales bacterium]|nr:hypothetical protein [Coriobacteriales bacterium]
MTTPPVDVEDEEQTHSPENEQPQPYAAELAQLPKLNIGALLMPAIWGPAHGQWITILFYPLWLFADISFTNAIFYGGLAMLLAITVFIGTAAFTIFYARTAGKSAYLRVADKMSLAEYLQGEKRWAFISAAIAFVLLALATGYNLALRLPAGPT